MRKPDGGIRVMSGACASDGETATQLVELAQVPLEEFVTRTDAYDNRDEGVFIRRHALDYAHQSDFIRLRALIEHGGIYADMDTLLFHRRKSRQKASNAWC